MTILSFIVALGLLVFIHEFGHFLLAKKQGIGVEKFSFGFGPKLFGIKKGETTYLVSALPLGGYVKLKGEEPDAAEKNDPRSYSGRPVSHRFRVVVAGPVMNLLLALTLMPLLFMVGRMEPAFLGEPPIVIGVRRDSPAQNAGLQKGDRLLTFKGRKVGNWKELLNQILIHGGSEIALEVRQQGVVVQKIVTIGRDETSQGGYLGIEPHYFIGNEAIVDEIGPGSPAAAAGLKVGDQVVEINGQAVDDWTRMSELVQGSQGKRLALRIKREGRLVRLSIEPKYDPSVGRWLLGVQKDVQKRAPPTVLRKYGPVEAVRRGTEENIRLGQMTLTVLKRLVTFDLSYKTLGGPIRIAQVAGAAARSSLADFLYFVAFLSLQLGLLNLLPIPVLDGGHILFLGVEQVFRRPVSPRVRGVVEQAGFFLLVGLMVLITVNDVESIWGFREIFEKIRGLF